MKKLGKEGWIYNTTMDESLIYLRGKLYPLAELLDPLVDILEAKQKEKTNDGQK